MSHEVPFSDDPTEQMIGSTQDEYESGWLLCSDCETLFKDLDALDSHRCIAE